MAPRSRSMVGTTRRDGALDAMKLMGFPENAVRRTLIRLLNIYGADGWAFIEDDAYRVLVDELLEPNDVDQLNDQNQDNVMVRENQADEGWVEENFGYPDNAVDDHPQPSELVNGQEVQAPVEYVQGYTVVELNPVFEPTEVGGNNTRVQEMTQQEQVERAVENHVEREGITQQRQAEETEPAKKNTVEHEISGRVTQRRTIGESGLRPFVPAVRRRRTPHLRVPRSFVPASTQTHTTHASGLHVSILASTPKHTTRARDAQVFVVRPTRTMRANESQVAVPAITPTRTTRASDIRTATNHQRRKPCFGWIDSDDEED